MNGWRGFAKLQRKQTLKAQQPAPNAQLRRLKTRWMTISTSLLRWDFCSNRFVKRIGRWIGTKWTHIRQAHGWIGGSGSTLSSTSNRTPRCASQPKCQSSHNSARTPDTKRIGNAAMNYASKFLRWAGTCAMRRTDQSSRAGPAPTSGLLLFKSVAKSLDLGSEPGPHEFAKLVVVIS